MFDGLPRSDPVRCVSISRRSSLASSSEANSSAFFGLGRNHSRSLFNIAAPFRRFGRNASRLVPLKAHHPNKPARALREITPTTAATVLTSQRSQSGPVKWRPWDVTLGFSLVSSARMERYLHTNRTACSNAAELAVARPFDG